MPMRSPLAPSVSVGVYNRFFRHVIYVPIEDNRNKLFVIMVGF